MATEGAVNTSTELRKRRSTRIVQAVPLTVTGVDALGRPFAERTSTLIINCHGCRYQSKHYVLKNMWVNLEVPHPESGHAPRRVRGKVAWIQRPRTVRQLFQVAWNWKSPAMPGELRSRRMTGSHSRKSQAFPRAVGCAAELAASSAMPWPGEVSLPWLKRSRADHRRTIAGVPCPGERHGRVAATGAAGGATAGGSKAADSCGRRGRPPCRRSVPRNIAWPLSSGSRSTWHSAKRWRGKRPRPSETIQEEPGTQARTAQAAAAESLKNELPRWLAPQLEQLTHELTAQLAREGAMQRDQHEKQLAAAHETLQTLCAQAEEAAAKLRTQAGAVETQVAARLEAAKQQAGRRGAAARGMGRGAAGSAGRGC